MREAAHPDLAVLVGEADHRAARYLMHRLANTVHVLGIYLAMKPASEIAGDPALVAAQGAIDRVRAMIDELRAVIEPPERQRGA